MSKREGKHYKRRKNEEKESYSVRSLVTDITGISKNDVGFEAAYKEIQRIIKTFQAQDGVDEGTLKVPKDQKASFVESTKAFYDDIEFKDRLAKIRKGENLTIEEHDILIEHFVESMAKDKTEEEMKKIREFVEREKEDEYFEKIDIMRSNVMQDIKTVGKIKKYESKLLYMDMYMEIQDSAFSIWRDKINEHILIESVQERVLEKEPHLATQEPLPGVNMSRELLNKVILELMNIEDE